MGFLDRFGFGKKPMRESLEQPPVPRHKLLRRDSDINEIRLSYKQNQALQTGVRVPVVYQDFVGLDPIASSNLMTAYTLAVDTKVDFYRAMESMAGFWLIDAIFDLVLQDVVAHPEEEDLLSITSPNAEYQQAIDDFQEAIDFEEMIRDIGPEAIANGGYILSLRGDANKKTGVTAIMDDVDQINSVALYEQGLATEILMLDNGQYVVKSGGDYIHFSLSNTKLRIKLQDMLGGMTAAGMEPQKVKQEIADKLPDYIRVDKPFFYNKIGKLRELEVLETLLVAFKFNQLTQSKFVGVEVSGVMDTKQVSAILQHMEEILNSQSGVNTQEQKLSAAAVISALNRFKAMPIYRGGGDDKGNIEALNIREDQTIDDLLNAVTEYRGLLMSSLGIPPSFIWGGGNKGENQTDDRAKEIRVQGRYARMLSHIQRGFARGIKQLVITHLVNLGYDVELKDVDVRFKQYIPDISGLEGLELTDATQEIVARRIEFATALIQNPVFGTKFDPKKIDNFVNDALLILTKGESLFLEEYIDQGPHRADLEIKRTHGEPLKISKVAYLSAVTKKFRTLRGLSENTAGSNLESYVAEAVDVEIEPEDDDLQEIFNLENNQQVEG